ncbi:hypothetical protein C8Q79DRAFT_898325, partial [Trametes meyenii]
NPGNNLHVSGLSHKVDTRDLEAAFAKVGRVQKAQVMYDPHSRESRGFGFVTMETAEEADAAITAMNGTELMGKSISVEKVCDSPVNARKHQLTQSLSGASWPCADADSRSLLWAAEEKRSYVYFYSVQSTYSCQ